MHRNNIYSAVDSKLADPLQIFTTKYNTNLEYYKNKR